METIRYVSEEGTILEYRENKKWYRKNKLIPEATFYEGGGDEEKMRKYRSTSVDMDVEEFLHNKDDPDSLCPTGRIYLPRKINGERRIVRTSILTRI